MSYDLSHAYISKLLSLCQDAFLTFVVLSAQNVITSGLHKASSHLCELRSVVLSLDHVSNTASLKPTSFLAQAFSLFFVLFCFFSHNLSGIIEFICPFILSFILEYKVYESKDFVLLIAVFGIICGT